MYSLVMKKDLIRNSQYVWLAGVSMFASLLAVVLAFNVMSDRTNNQCYSQPLQYVVWMVAPVVAFLGLLQLLNSVLSKKYKLLWFAVPIMGIACLSSVVAFFFSVFCYQF